MPKQIKMTLRRKKEIGEYMALIGSRGGKSGTGEAKARTHEQAVAAGLARARKAGQNIGVRIERVK